MIRINRPRAECGICEAFKPILVTNKIREDGEVVDQFVNIDCGNSWICNQIRKAIDREKVQQDEQYETDDG